MSPEAAFKKTLYKPPLSVPVPARVVCFQDLSREGSLKRTFLEFRLSATRKVVPRVVSCRQADLGTQRAIAITRAVRPGRPESGDAAVGRGGEAPAARLPLLPSGGFGGRPPLSRPPQGTKQPLV